MATEKTELLSPDTCSTLSCINDDKLLEIDDHIQLQNMNNIKLWNDNLLSNQTLPFNINMANVANNYDNAQKVSFDNEIVLNANNLNYQQPTVRYVNVNVNNEFYNPDSTFADSPDKSTIVSMNDTCKASVNC